MQLPFRAVLSLLASEQTAGTREAREGFGRHWVSRARCWRGGAPFQGVPPQRCRLRPSPRQTVPHLNPCPCPCPCSYPLLNSPQREHRRRRPRGLAGAGRRAARDGGPAAPAGGTCEGAANGVVGPPCGCPREHAAAFPPQSTYRQQLVPVNPRRTLARPTRTLTSLPAPLLRPAPHPTPTPQGAPAVPDQQLHRRHLAGPALDAGAAAAPGTGAGKAPRQGQEPGERAPSPGATEPTTCTAPAPTRDPRDQPFTRPRRRRSTRARCWPRFSLPSPARPRARGSSQSLPPIRRRRRGCATTGEAGGADIRFGALAWRAGPPPVCEAGVRVDGCCLSPAHVAASPGPLPRFSSSSQGAAARELGEQAGFRVEHRARAGQAHGGRRSAVEPRRGGAEPAALLRRWLGVQGVAGGQEGRGWRTRGCGIASWRCRAHCTTSQVAGGQGGRGGAAGG
jgi:hypothetical protein